jgi:hypothetical protein
MVSDIVTYWSDVFQSAGGLGTVGALIFVGIQTVYNRRQLDAVRQQLGRAWIGRE